MNKIFGIGIAAMMLLVGLMSAMPSANAANAPPKIEIRFIADFTNPLYEPEQGGELMTIEIGSLVIKSDGDEVASVIAAMPEGIQASLLILKAIEQKLGISLGWEVQAEYTVSSVQSSGPIIGHISGGQYEIWYGNLKVASAPGYQVTLDGLHMNVQGQ
jgi:hypothetical protein